MTVYRIDLAYDGSGFHGYARQPGLRTVQGELEAALAPFIGGVETFVAGRTDRGVHATGQVASFEVDAVLDTARVRRSLNARLAPEIAVSAVSEAPPGFHARFSATGRSYTYLIIDGEVPDPFLAATSWHLGSALDEALMSRAAAHLVGEHDFSSLCRRSGDRSLVRRVEHAAWSRRRPDLVALDISASSFCHQMVRSVVALCVDVGRGRIDPDSVPAVLAALDRHAARGAAPPHGLTLTAVQYPVSSI